MGMESRRLRSSDDCGRPGDHGPVARVGGPTAICQIGDQQKPGGTINMFVDHEHHEYREQGTREALPKDV
jgi:hypothetical protein